MTHPPRPQRRHAWLIPLLALSLVGLASAIALEVAARSFWSLRYDVPFGRPGYILSAFYPELRRVDYKRPSHGDEFYDVLFLGGSVLHGDWSQVEQALREQLAFAGHRNVRVFNLAAPAHTTRDSRIKYGALRRPRFELVLVYHGVNDARTNNVPPDLFRPDYGHYTWYETVNLLAPYHGRAKLALPYTLRYLALLARQRARPDRYVPREAPRPDWVRYGSDPRSREAFRDNLETILEVAGRRKDQVLLATFATRLPADYSLEAFRAGRLDYGLHRTPIEDWGRREDVVGAIAAHNEVVRRLAARGQGVLFVDQAGLMAGSALWFNDFCHLTVAGSSRFVENLLPVVLPAVRAREAGRATPR
jgi:hypothetical protein